jgi:hypothetical protein
MEREFYKALLTTAENAGLKILSDDYCCQLLAWVYAYGGGNESVVLNVRMNEDIQIAQKRLNIIGGEVVNKELYDVLQKYLSQVKDISTSPDTKSIEGSHPDWAYEICKKYGLSTKVLKA